MSEPSRTPVPADLVPQAEPGATQPQISYICDLLDKRQLFAWPEFFDKVNAMDVEEYNDYLDKVKDDVAALATRPGGKKRASGIIQVLKALPYKSEQDKQSLSRAGTAAREHAAVPSTPSGGRVYHESKRVKVEYADVPTDDGKTRRIGRIAVPDARPVLAGSYGVSTADDDRFTNDFSFFKVWVGDRGGWSVKLYVSDYTDRVTLAFPTQLDALKKIAVDPDAASRAFGLEFGRCGVCGRGLTNDESRALGIGPVCRQNVGRY